MSLIIIPQYSSKSLHWTPEVIDKPSFVENLYKLVERKTMNMEIISYFTEAGEEFECIKFTSCCGTLANTVYSKIKGPVVFLKKDGFNESQQKYMCKMLEKIRGKQPCT